MPSQTRISSRLRSSAAKKIQKRFKSRKRLRSKASRKIQARVRGRQTRKVINREQNTSTTVNDCPICFEPLTNDTNVRIALPCGHRFHEECIRQSLTSTRGRCPLCRRDVTNMRYPSIQQAQAQTQAQAILDTRQRIEENNTRLQYLDDRILYLDSIINRPRHGLRPRDALNATQIARHFGPPTHLG